MKPYPYELRIRIFSCLLWNSIRKTAELFNVSPNTVLLLKKLFIETGSLDPRKRNDEHPHLITPEGELFLQSLLLDEPDLTLEELCTRYEGIYGIRVSVGTMFNTLKKMKITRKKKKFSDPKKNTDNAKIKKEEYAEKLEKIEPEKRIYLDETGCCLNMSPAYGRSKQGLPAYDDKPTSPGERVSTVAAITQEGIKATHTYQGSLTAKLFVPYLDTYVLPLLNDGQTIIMDNLPVHHEGAQGSVAQAERCATTPA